MLSVSSMLDRPRALFSSQSAETACACTTDFTAPGPVAVDSPDALALRVDATDCPGEGDLAVAADCRATVVAALADRDATAIHTRAGGIERTYTDDAVALLVAAGRFVDRAAHYDEGLATRALSDPLGAAHEATGRAGPVARVAAETGLALGAERVAGGYETALRCSIAPTVARCRVTIEPPAAATLVDGWSLDSGAAVKVYEVAENSLPHEVASTDTTERQRLYHLQPAWATLDAGALETLAAARRLLATGGVSGGERAPGRAVRRVAAADDPVERLTTLLTKHTQGHGVLDDLFADDRLTDVFLTGPVSENPVRVVVDGARLGTNIHATPEGAAALASRFRRTSGRAFSRATPTLDATVETSADRRIRVAGVAPPASDGFGFAFRAHDRATWTLPRLVACGTLPAAAAGLLSVAVERGAATLVAGPRGAGKTTTLGALLWELPRTTRTVVVEDTPELPVADLQAAGRDVQSVHTSLADDAALSPPEALRAALRLGDGALAIGEVRGEEATTLYEAMRVGAADGAVLGTVHGVGGAAVKARMVTDLGVDERAFGATDLVVTLTAESGRRVTRLEEVRATTDGVHFATLFECSGTTSESAALEATGIVDRGESTLVAALSSPDESYADVLTAVDRRTETIASSVRTGRIAPDDRGD